MDFDWLLKIIKNHYVDFKGRTNKKSFWMYVLFIVLISLALSVIDGILGLTGGLKSLFGVLIFVPTIAITVRRLQDTGKDWYWILLSFVPVIGQIIVIIFCIKDGDPGPNRFGPVPTDTVNNRNFM